MKNTLSKRHPQYLLCASAALTLAVSGTVPIVAQQQPVLVAASTHNTALRLPVVSPEPAAAVPEAPQNDSNGAPLKDDLFEGTEKFAKNATDATEVNMDPDSLRMVGGPQAARAHRTLLSVVRSYTYDKPGMYNMADVEEFRHKLETGGWHCSVHTRDLKTGESTDICSRRRAPDMIENAIITVEPKELTFIHNIQKADGQGGQVDWFTRPGMSLAPSMSPGVPPSASFAALAPEMRAELAASRAGWIADNAAMRADLLASNAAMRAELKAEMRTDVGHMGENGEAIAEHLSDQLGHVRDMLKDMPSLKDNQQLERLRERLGDMRDLGSR